MIYNKEADTITEGLGLTLEKQKELASKYLKGSRAEVLFTLCSSEDLEENERFALFIEFGSRLVIDEVDLMAKEHEKYLNAKQGDSGEED